jgi:hypothetical protein
VDEINVTRPNDDGIVATWHDGAVFVRFRDGSTMSVEHLWNVRQSREENAASAWDAVVAAIQGS